MPNTLLSRRSFCIAGISFSALSSAALPAFAKTISRFSLSRNGTALKGYDTTAYFKTDKPAKGSTATTVTWKGATWRFASAADADLFRANPDAYAPQFGGYCTRAMSLGKEVPSDPEVWRIHKGNLHVFYARRGGTAFDKGPDAMIKLAQAHWDTLTLVE
ncbi:MAG: YHS domain-containing (seleno)protein [Pseudoruegeria sp.]